MFTPIVKSKMNFNNVDLYYKRDDLLPFSFGGNKVRIAIEFFKDMKQKGNDCIIGYGNARSNLCRVLSNMACSENIPCIIVSPSDDDGTVVKTNNSLLTSLCGAEIVQCNKNNVSLTVQSVINKCIQQGFSPYYMYGNKYGNGNKKTPVKAYCIGYKEIISQARDMNIKFDYIFVATGTGMTHAGLLAGKYESNSPERIVGMSVARPENVCRDKIDDYLKSYFLNRKDFNSDFLNEIIVSDKCLCGGYGKFDEEIVNTISGVYRIDGIPLDTTYTGKAFCGMKKYIHDNNISGNVLFVHTGGTPLFFDDFATLN